ncbi:MAG: T6SS effector amidase Tae4 family protein [Fluviicola sp.]
MNNNRLLVLEQKVMRNKSAFSEAHGNTFPSPQKIKSNYPKKEGNNECAMRLSFALIKSGISETRLKKSDKFRKTAKKGGKLYQPSAAALADWLFTELKYPQKMTHPTGRWKLSDFAGKSGIIYFAHDNRGGDRGFGHIDVIYNGVMGDNFYDNKVVWFWEFANGSWANTSSGQSLMLGDYSQQMNPGLFGIAGLEAVEAITLGLTATQTVAQAAQQNGKLSYQPVKASRTMKKEPQPYSRTPYTHKIFGASIYTGLGTALANVTFELKVDWNNYGEMIGFVQHSLDDSSAFDYTSMNVTFTNLGMYPRQGGEKDPRAWPIRFSYQGNYDPWGNGSFDFQGEFEFNAFGYFKILKHKVVSRSFADWAIIGKPEDAVYSFPSKTHYSIPPLPPAQRRILMQNYKNDPNYKHYQK